MYATAKAPVGVVGCDICDYKCKKNLTMKKHMAIKHQDPKGDDNYWCSSKDEIFSLSEIKDHTLTTHE